MDQVVEQTTRPRDEVLQRGLPSGYVLRAPTLADVPATVAMQNASALDITGNIQFSEEEFQADWQEPGFDLATDARVVTTADGQVVASADVIFQPPYVRNFIWARVHPNFRGQSIGTVLTQWAEARIIERMVDAPVDARIVAGCSTINTHRAAAELLTNLGYAHIRSFYSMRIEMNDAPPLPIWPADITVRTMIAGQDEAAVYRAKEEAFHDHWGHVPIAFEEGFATWQHHLQHNSAHDPALFFLAMAGDEIAGCALCDPKTSDYPDMAWVDSLGVRRPWRRQGLALALLHHAFGEFYRRGIKKVGLGVDASSLTGAIRLYERAGMQVFRQSDAYEKELRPGRDLTRQQVRET